MSLLSDGGNSGPITAQSDSSCQLCPCEPPSQEEEPDWGEQQNVTHGSLRALERLPSLLCGRSLQEVLWEANEKLLD